MPGLDRSRIGPLTERELELFRRTHPGSGELARQARASLLYGVPMNWMIRTPGAWPVFIDQAQGAHCTDVDGNDLTDFCLGDTGAMAGHGPPAVVRALAGQAGRGLTFMLPTRDAAWVGNELTRRFGVPYWQFALTATDANRFAIRWAREITGRPKIVVHNWNYHGSVDETMAQLSDDGALVPRAGLIGQATPLDLTTKVVEINDLEGLELALRDRDVACVLFEPALTNIGIVLPEPGYHDDVRRLCDEHGTLLIIDETHTICAGPGGCTRAWQLSPDIVTIGKTLGAGVPAAAFGVTAAVADQIYAHTDLVHADVGGTGGTLAGNALSMAAMRATLSGVLTDAAFARMIELGERFERGVQQVIDVCRLPFHVTRLGCRTEYLFRPQRATTGAQAAAGQDQDLDSLIHLYMLNRGILMTPFHNMALMSPATEEQDVDRHTEVFAEAMQELGGTG
ncbi:MAG TPA: transaminase [Streptosporangiaceae bacterium]